MVISQEARLKMGWRKGKLFSAYFKNCIICNKLFKTVPTSSKQYTCGMVCAGIVKKHKRKTILCKECSKPMEVIITRNRRYCSLECKMKMLVKLRIETYKDKREFGKWKNRKELKAYLLDKYKSCQICGWNKEPGILEAHHKDRNSKNNSEDNLLLVCPNCHSLEHFNKKDGQYKMSKFYAINKKGEHNT